MKQLLKRVSFVFLSVFTSLSFAQQAPAANPMDDIPENMPFDIPYGAAISL